MVLFFTLVGVHWVIGFMELEAGGVDSLVACRAIPSCPVWCVWLEKKQEGFR